MDCSSPTSSLILNCAGDDLQTAWLCEAKALPVIGDGNNIIPTLHVSDLASVVRLHATCSHALQHHCSRNACRRCKLCLRIRRRSSSTWWLSTTRQSRSDKSFKSATLPRFVLLQRVLIFAAMYSMQAISSGLGTGELFTVDPNDEKVLLGQVWLF